MKKKHIQYLFILGLISTPVFFYVNREIPGCIDPKMYNFNIDANTDDGSCTPFLYGCTDRKAINFNVEANTMQDSSCIIVENVSCANYPNKPKKNLRVDNKKFNDYTFKFIYSCDKVVSEDYKILPSGYYYLHKILSTNDTLTYDGASYISLPVGENIKVIEDIKGYKPRNYFIDIRDDVNNYLINPRGLYRYKIEKHTYGGLPVLFGSRDIKTKKGFLIEINHRMDWWFEEAPASITTTTYNGIQDFSTHYRYNIIRY